MPRPFPLLAIFLLAVALLFPAPGACADHNVGLRTIGHTDASRGLRLDVNVWYPTAKAPRRQRFPPWDLMGARDAKPLPGPFPLLLLSHSTAGNRFTYHDTALALAEAGFVVAAPTHPGDNMDNMPDLYSWRQLSPRVTELSALVDVLEADGELGPSIDRNRIGALGFGSGATTVLLLGGALPDCAEWEQFCREGREEEDTGIYCNAWVRPRIGQRLCTALPLTKSPADTRIRAVAAIDPDFAMLFTQKSLRWFAPPLLLVTAARERTNPARATARLATLFPVPPKRLSLEQADAGALMAPCPEALAEELPELCRSCSEEERRSTHAALVAALVDFFQDRLVKRPPAVIPPPPDLAPRKEKPVTKSATPRRSGSRRGARSSRESRESGRR